MKKILSVHITDLCNSACKFCVVGVPEIKGDTIVPGRVEQILRQNAGKGYEAVNLHGGEPTIHKNFIEILELIRDLGYPSVHIQTNGQRLKEQKFVEKLRGFNVDLFIVSLHGNNAETHDNVTRCLGSFNSATEGIINVKRLGGFVRTNTVILKQNLPDLPAMIDLLIDLDVDHINISNLHPVFTAYLHFDEIVPTAKETNFWVSLAMKKAVARSAFVTLEGFPICLIPGYEEYHLGRRNGRMTMEIRGVWINDYDRFMDEQCRIKGDNCPQCIHYDDCGGVYKEYVEKRGWSEFAPIEEISSHGFITRSHVVKDLRGERV
jgi:MoaA/NifB/PqqE/SkfB family radical SAM enzyme